MISNPRSAIQVQDLLFIAPGFHLDDLLPLILQPVHTGQQQGAVEVHTAVVVVQPGSVNVAGGADLAGRCALRLVSTRLMPTTLPEGE